MDLDPWNNITNIALFWEFSAFTSDSVLACYCDSYHQFILGKSSLEGVGDVLSVDAISATRHATSMGTDSTIKQCL